MTAKQKAQEVFRMRWAYLMMLMSVTFMVAVFLGRPASSHHVTNHMPAEILVVSQP